MRNAIGLVFIGAAGTIGTIGFLLQLLYAFGSFYAAYRVFTGLYVDAESLVTAIGSAALAFIVVLTVTGWAASLAQRVSSGMKRAGQMLAA